jgi:drug/metabolite transporter (DMT)-like permease
MTPSSLHTRFSPVTVVAAGATLLGFTPMFTKMLGLHGIGPTEIGFWRALFGALIFAMWIAISGRSFILPKRVAFWSLFGGIIFAGDLFNWHRSILIVGSGMATILGNTQVFATAILSYFLFKEKLSLRFVVAALLAIAGVALLVGFGSGVAFTAEYLAGVVVGLLTAIFYANYIIVLRKAGSGKLRPDFVVVMGYASVATAVTLGIISYFEHGIPALPDAYGIGLLLGLALVGQVVGWWLISSSLPHVRGAISGLILLIQPVGATILGAIVFGESLRALQIFGALITLVCIYIGSAGSAESKRPAA